MTTENIYRTLYGINVFDMTLVWKFSSAVTWMSISQYNNIPTTIKKLKKQFCFFVKEADTGNMQESRIGKYDHITLNYIPSKASVLLFLLYTFKILTEFSVLNNIIKK